MNSGKTPKTKSRKRLLKRKSSFSADSTGSPQAGTSVTSTNQFLNRNCSTPVSSTTGKDGNAWNSPQLASSPIRALSQDLYKQTGVAWQWESPRQSPLAKRRLTRRSIVVVQKDSVGEGKRMLRSQTAKKSGKNQPKENDEGGAGGFLKFREDLMTLDTSPELAPEANGSPSVEQKEKSATSKVETTADMVKYVLDGSDTFCVNGEKTIEKPKGAATRDDRDFLFDDSAIDRDLEALAKEVEAKTATVPKGPPDKGAAGESEEFVFTAEEEKKTDVAKVPPKSQMTTRNEDLKWLDDTSFDEILSQMPLDAPGTSRNASFGRHATMPAQKQTQPDVKNNVSKGIFRYDSMPTDSTTNREPAQSLSRNGSNESVSSTSSAGRCSAREIQLKRLEAKQRLLKNSLQQKNINKR
ncbi:uncharacterized protein LOC129787172 [Lutzomyia longipalpis]|uniref:uncharacterized protein LOC129787172 n=1 Tax=Lutzomyia longipalpis TaxID=7200 RepID=UPI0024842515|nr:uncharacterized protein LOC129787172 [Lutzomyia longipalpis]